MYSPDLDVLWPGALIQGDGYEKGIGSVRELPIRKRAPLGISVNLLTVPNSKIVKNPSASTVNAAVGELIAAIKGVDVGGSIYFNLKETYSFEQATMSFGLSAKYAGASMSAKHNSIITSTERNVITACYIQNKFSVFIDQPATPADFFSPDCSLADIKEQASLGRIGKDNIPVYISTVTWGRLVLATISSTKSMSELKTALTASYNAGGTGGSGTLDQTSKDILNSSELIVTGIGVADSAAANLIKSGTIQGFFSSPMTVESVRPISYIFRVMNSGAIAGITDTTKYNITVCRPKRVDHPSAGVATRAASIEDNLRKYPGFVSAAVGNFSDLDTRRLRTQQFIYLSSLVVSDLNVFRTDAGKLSGDDKTWIIDWLGGIIKEIQRQAAVWQYGYNANSSDVGSRDVYGIAINYTGQQGAAATATSTALQK